MVWKENIWFDGNPHPFFVFLNEYFPNADYDDPRELFHHMISLQLKRFPRDIIFANFQCLRCGLCCKNYEGADIFGDLEEKLKSDGKEHLLKYIWIVRCKDGAIGGTIPTARGSCTLCRKAYSKPYYHCRINDYKEYLPTCSAYLCSKSLPVAHLNYNDIDELIELLGLEEYDKLIRRDWGEEFDWSHVEVKTYRTRPNYLRGK